MDLDLNTHMECRTREMTMKITQTWSKSGFPYTSSRIGGRFPPSWDTDQRAEIIRRLRSPPRDDIDRQHSMVALDMTTMSDFGDILTLEITFQSDIMNPVNVSRPIAFSGCGRFAATVDVAQMARLDVGRYLSKDTSNFVLAHSPLQIHVLTMRWLSTARYVTVDSSD